MDDLAIIVPCYNEEQTIGLVIEDLQTYLPQAEIYVYNNNSTDRTVDIAHLYDVHVRNCVKQGKGNVVQAAFQEVDAKNYLILDGDYTSFASDAHKLLEQLELGADMVVGNRLSAYEKDGNRARAIGNRLFSKLVKLIHRHISDDPLSGYRAFSRNFVQHVTLESEGFTIEIEMEIKSKPFKVVSVPVQYRDRPEGSKSKLKAFSDGRKIIWYALTHRKG